MAKKTTTGATRPTPQQKSKEEQWRRRVAAQTRATTPTLSDGGAGDAGGTEEMAGYTQAEMRQMPNVATSGSARSSGAATNVARTTSATTAATQRRALANRATRTRIGANAMSLDEEMRYVKSDVRALIILTAICLAVIIVLSFVIR